jgi:hypothetical protein
MILPGVDHAPAEPETCRREPALPPRRLLAVWVALAALGVACADTPTAATANTVAPDAIESVDHEPCPTEGHKVEVFATRADGKAVVTKVFDGSGHELCRFSDMSHSGKPDFYEYFDSSGQVRRREADYDANGTIDAVEFYEGGKLVKREYDTTGQHRVDTWDYFDKATGLRTRRERDTTNDGKVDQWWTWSGDRITIAIDRNGDGQPDPGATLVMDAKTGTEIVDSKDAKTAPPAGSASSATTGDGGAPPAPSSATSAIPPPPPPPPSPTASAPPARKAGASK